VTSWDDEEDQLEQRLRRLALPVTLFCAFAIAATGPGRFLLRLFCGMWIHELGHAVTAWLCGFPALPGPWVTATAEDRSALFTALLGAGLVAFAISSWLAARRERALAAAGLLVLQLGASFVLSREHARALIYFGGDGGCLVLGSLLMATLYAPRGSALHRDWLRWGLLVIGAAAFADVFSQWWAARSDYERIPFGANEGVGLSDPSALSETYGWSANQLVGRYVALGSACFASLALLYAWGLRQRPAGERERKAGY
jgi:hypothetical protein